MLPGAIPGLPGRPRLPPSARASLGSVSPLGVWRSARLRVGAGRGPPGRTGPSGWSANPQPCSFWPGPGPARAKTARGPPSFPQGAFSQKPTPTVTDRSRLRALLSYPGLSSRPTIHVEPDPGTMLCGPPRRTGLPAHARWPEAQRLQRFTPSARIRRTTRQLRAWEGARNGAAFDAPTGALRIPSGPRSAGFLPRLSPCLSWPSLREGQDKCCFAHSFVGSGSHWAGGRLLPERNDPGQASLRIDARRAS